MQRILFVCFLCISFAQAGKCVPALLTVAKNAKPDGRFLVQTKLYGLAQADDRFILPMGEAIRLVGLAMQKKPYPDHSDFAHWISVIAAVRHYIAVAMHEKDARKYGLLLPETTETMVEFMNKATDGLWPQVLSLQTYRPVDVISRPHQRVFSNLRGGIPFHEGPRHAAFFDRALALSRVHEERPPEYFLDENESVVLSTVTTFRVGTVPSGALEPTYLLVRHPSLHDMVKLRTRAYKLLSEATHTRDLNSVAQAYLLLMHAIPCHRGSPSVVEALLDAYLRTYYQKSFAAKNSEPFWEAMLFHGEPHTYNAEDFLKSFGEK